MDRFSHEDNHAVLSPEVGHSTWEQRTRLQCIVRFGFVNELALVWTLAPN